MKTSLEDINPFRKFAMVLSRFNPLLPRLKALCGASYLWKFRPNLMGNFSLTADSDSWFFFSVLPTLEKNIWLVDHVLWSVQETRAILSTNQITNLEPSAPGHSYFPALQAVCLRWLWSLTGYLWHFPLFWLLCFHFDITQLYYYFSNCYQLSVQKPKQKLSQLTTNQNKCYHHYCPVRTESLKRGKTRVIKMGLVFCSAFDWLKWRGEFSGPIKEQSKTKPMQLRITFDYQLKSALFYLLEFSAVHVILKKSEEKQNTFRTENY